MYNNLEHNKPLKHKLTDQNRHFMKSSDVECCLADLNNIKCEGFDRIPKCALYDARVTLLNPLVCSSKKLTLREVFTVI